MCNASLVAIGLLVTVTIVLSGPVHAEDGAGKPLHLQDLPLVTPPKEFPDRVPGQSGGDNGIRIRVAKIWRREKQTYASINVRNVAPYEFHDITIVCTAFDEHNQALGSRQADLSAQRYGPLRPGFTTVLDVAFDTGQAQVRSLSCDAHARGLPHRVD